MWGNSALHEVSTELMFVFIYIIKNMSSLNYEKCKLGYNYLIPS